jgi:hypothetical protein
MSDTVGQCHMRCEASVRGIEAQVCAVLYAVLCCTLCAASRGCGLGVEL